MVIIFALSYRLRSHQLRYFDTSNSSSSWLHSTSKAEEAVAAAPLAVAKERVPEQRKITIPPPSGFEALMNVVNKMEEELNGAAFLSRTVEPAPTSPKTPELFILNDDDDASPPPAPVVAGRHRLQRQHAVMVHATPCGRPVMPVVTEEPRIGAASRQPPPPSPEIVVISDDENGDVDETINNLFPTIRRRLDYEMEEDEEGKEEEEEKEVDDDSGMEEGEIVEPEDSDMTDVAENIPVRMNVPSGPLIMAINSLTNKVN
ncbi:uncharacterized protein LOC129284289 isoform X1 [Lytechinus pictus]|uniref:uncharacterized protein LOC129284289 isoform X1 n=1 Tax=Lytechinus pictus TaxID=7653 RepID=UPI0030BA01D1